MWADEGRQAGMLEVAPVYWLLAGPAGSQMDMVISLQKLLCITPFFRVQRLLIMTDLGSHLW